MLCAFAVGFEKVFKSCLLLLAALIGLTLPCAIASLQAPAMIVYDVTTKVLGTEEFPQHVADLISGITFVLFSQKKPLQ